MDYTTKNPLYSDVGVREYWIVDPEKERTTDLLLRAGWSTDDKPIYSDDSKWDLWRIGD